MKKNLFKISIIVLCFIACLTVTACANTGSIWNYLIGNYNGLYDNPSGSIVPSGSGSQITVNVGDATTQTGGLADLVSSCEKSVVEVYATYFFTKGGDEYVSYSYGSGVIVKLDGAGAYIITNSQVILDGADQGQYLYQKMEVAVRFNSGVESLARIDYRDYTLDVALLFVDKTNLDDYFGDLRATSLSKDLTEGEKVVAIGNPFMDGTTGVSATAGVISATSREMGIGNNRKANLIQTDTAVNGGNTGGGLFDMDGKLIGIVNGKIVATGVEGLGFALPIQKTLDVLHQAGHLTDITV